jgi:periplasmic divalent cation tolerance protein
MAAVASQAVIVIVTAGSEEQASAIARVLVGERLAACVNIVGPIRSIYRWRDAVEDEREYLMLVKTRANLYERVERRVKDLHGYEVPEVLALSPRAGSSPYLQWLMESTVDSSQKGAVRRASGRRAR